MSKQQMQKVDFPIFSIATLKNYVIISGGGGGKKYGLPNKIAVYLKGESLKQLKEKVFEINTGDDNIIENLRVNHKSQQIVANSEDKCVIYKFNDDDSQKPTIKEIQRFKSDFSLKDPCQNDGKFSSNMSYLGTGGDDCSVRVYKVSGNEKEISKNSEFQIEEKPLFEFSDHTAGISSLDFHPKQNLLISSSEDKSCRVYNLDKNIQVQKISFTDITQMQSYKFLAAYFSLDGGNIYTIQNPMRGPSYMSVWDMQKTSIEHQKNIKLHNQPCTATAISRNGNFIGIGTGDGAVKIINLNKFDIETQKHPHSMVVKGLDFTADSKCLVSGTPEFDLDLLQNVRSGRFTQMFAYILIMGILLAWIIDYFIIQ